jgi:hypothetical protein
MKTVFLPLPPVNHRLRPFNPPKALFMTFLRRAFFVIHRVQSTLLFCLSAVQKKSILLIN